METTAKIKQPDWNSTHAFLKESNAIEGVYDKESLRQAFFSWDHLIKQPELTHGVILKMHKILMLKDQNLMPHQRGYYRSLSKTNVTIGGRVAPAHFLVDGLMENWLLDHARPKTEEAIKQAHIRYEEIHSFVDGNGRTGRMIMNWQRLQIGLPILVIKESEKQEYYSWFK